MAKGDYLARIQGRADWLEELVRFHWPMRNSTTPQWAETSRFYLHFYCAELRRLRNQIRTLETASGNAATAAER